MKSTWLILIVCLVTGVSCATRSGYDESSGAVPASPISVSVIEEKNDREEKIDGDGEEENDGEIQESPNRFYYNNSYEFPYLGQHDEEKLPAREEPAESGPLVDLPPDPARLPPRAPPRARPGVTGPSLPGEAPASRSSLGDDAAPEPLLPRPPGVRRSAASSQSGDTWEPVPPVEPLVITRQPSTGPDPESAAGPPEPEAEPRQTATVRPPPPAPQRQPVPVIKSEPPRQRDRTAPSFLPGIITVTVHPALPPVGDGKIYRLYVGSFKKEQWANRAFRDLYRQNLDPEIEQEDSFFQVFIPGVYAEDIPLMAEKIAAAGFRDIWLIR